MYSDRELRDAAINIAKMVGQLDNIGANITAGVRDYVYVR